MKDQCPKCGAPCAAIPATPQAEALAELRRALAVIGVVGQIDGHDVVRRLSVLEMADRAALPQPTTVQQAEGDARELISNYRKAVVEWCQTQTEEDFGRMVAEQKALFAALKTAPTAAPGDAG